MKQCRPLALLALVLTLGAVAFGSSGAGGAARPLRVGLLAWSGPPVGIGLDLESGFVHAVRAFGLQGVIREVGPNETVNDGISYFVRQHYDLIVLATLDPSIVRIVDAAVKRFPRTRFLLPDVTASQRPARWHHVHAYGFRIEQAAFLAGYLGALVEERQRGRHVVSSVGGFPEPQLDPFIAGYQAGARTADPAVVTLNDYSYDFAAPHKCYAVALDQIGRGSGVVFDIAGGCGLGALQAAKERGVWGIGVDVDESSLGSFVLTSVLKHEGRALYLELSAFVHAKLAPAGFSWFGYRDGAVGLGRISARVPRSLLARLLRVEAQVKSGAIAVPRR